VINSLPVFRFPNWVSAQFPNGHPMIGNSYQGKTFHNSGFLFVRTINGNNLWTPPGRSKFVIILLGRDIRSVILSGY